MESKETVLSGKFPCRGVWIPAFAGMTAVGVWWCGAYDGALRDFRLEYIIFFAGGGGNFTLLDDFEGGGALGWCGWIGGGGNIQRLSESLEVPNSRLRGNDGRGFVWLLADLVG